MKIKRLPKYFEKRLSVEIGSKIKSAREECGLSQLELANIMGLKSGTAISMWENNQRQIRAVDLWAISQITNLPINHFI